MKPQDKIAIDNLRMEGKPAGEIASILRISPNTVRSHIRRHPVIPGTIRCMNCGKPVVQAPHRRMKKFCSDACRMQWWKEHPESLQKKAYYALTCQQCGKEFQSYGNKERNTAAGNATLLPADPYSPEQQIMYHTSLGLIDKLVQDGTSDSGGFQKSLCDSDEEIRSSGRQYIRRSSLTYPIIYGCI